MYCYRVSVRGHPGSFRALVNWVGLHWRNRVRHVPLRNPEAMPQVILTPYYLGRTVVTEELPDTSERREWLLLQIKWDGYSCFSPMHFIKRGHVCNILSTHNEMRWSNSLLSLRSNHKWLMELKNPQSLVLEVFYSDHRVMQQLPIG